MIKNVSGEFGRSRFTREFNTTASSGVEGEVQAQFIVNEDGRAETNSFKVLKATNDLFAAAVRSALPQMRFYPAEVGGKHVRQLVQQSFQFKLDR
jgi:protein TonB